MRILYDNALLNQDVVLDMKLHESTLCDNGKIPDMSKYHNNATVTGATWTWPYGRSFDIVDDYATFGDTSTLAWMHGKGNTAAFAWTVIYYLKFNNPATAPFNTLLDTGGITADTTTGISIIFFTRLLRIAISRSVVDSTVIYGDSTAFYPNNTLYHQLAITYDQSLANSNAKIYLDRAYVESLNKSTGAPVNGNSSYAPNIGKYSGGLGPVDGVLSEMYIYQQRVLSLAEIVQHGLAAKQRMSWANLP